MKIGFTGTKNGMTVHQKRVFDRMLFWLDERDHSQEFHHGACIGADEQAGQSAHELGFKIILHPPVNKSYMAVCYSDVKKPARPYLVRNHDIVDESDILIATPKTNEEELRSGTWATVRYARKIKRMIFLIYPDGTTERQ